MAAPFATIGQAFSHASAGSRIRVQAGIYGAVGGLADIQGSDTNPIAIVADGDVVIDAGGSGSGITNNNPKPTARPPALHKRPCHPALQKLTLNPTRAALYVCQL